MDSKTANEALEEFVKVLEEIGSGRCPHREFMGYLNNSRECREGKHFSRTSHYCDDLKNSMQCYDHVETCYTDKNLNKFKGAALELSVQTIGMFSDEAEDMLQDCPIYIELVGLRNSKKLLYAGIAVGLVIVAAFLVCFFLSEKTPRVFWVFLRSNSNRAEILSRGCIDCILDQSRNISRCTNKQLGLLGLEVIFLVGVIILLA